MSVEIRIVLLLPILLIVVSLIDSSYARTATASESTDTGNAVVEYLDDATENTMGEDHRQVLKQALTDMLDLPLKQLVEKNYPDFEMRPDSWSISVILQRYIAPRRQDLTTSDKFFDDLETPEAKRAIRAWLAQINRETAVSLGSTRPRNTVEDYLNGAEEQCECEFQGAAIRQAFVDMLYEPVESLRKKRYSDDESDSHKCTITELLNHHFVPDSYANFDKDEFFRDVKKPEAQEVIQKWLDHMDHPDGRNGPPREERQ